MIRPGHSLLLLLAVTFFLLAQAPAFTAVEKMVETCEEKGEGEGESEVPKFHPANGHARSFMSQAAEAAALIAVHAHEAAPVGDHIDEVPVPPPEA